MSEDVQKKFEPLIKPIISRRDRRLLEKRFEAEYVASEFREKAKPSAGAPALPDAQLVYSPAGKLGVAVKGARFVCELPAGYSNVELALIDGNRMIVTCPTAPPLLIDPHTGAVRPL
jgi:hypothetical protein